MNERSEPETIFDLTPDELDFIILYRNLSQENQTQLADYICELVKNKIPEG